MMIYIKTIKNDNFCDGRSVDVYHNDIDNQYHCDFVNSTRTFYGTLAIFNDVQIKNDIYVLDVIDQFVNKLNMVDRILL